METIKYSLEDAEEIGKKLGVTFDKFDAGQFADGINTELAIAGKTPGKTISDEDLQKAAKTALAHLNELNDYYIRLQRKEMEDKGYYNT
ncbi:MAG: DUF5661 family protein [Ignavibacteria bacterium]